MTTEFRTQDLTTVVDSDGKVVARCASPAMATRIIAMLEALAGFETSAIACLNMAAWGDAYRALELKSAELQANLSNALAEKEALQARIAELESLLTPTQPIVPQYAEPWHVGFKDSLLINNENVIVELFNPPTIAHRVAACVRACAGVDNTALGYGAMAGIAAALQRETARAAALADENATLTARIAELQGEIDYIGETQAGQDRRTGWHIDALKQEIATLKTRVAELEQPPSQDHIGRASRVVKQTLGLGDSSLYDPMLDQIIAAVAAEFAGDARRMAETSDRYVDDLQTAQEATTAAEYRSIAWMRDHHTEQKAHQQTRDLLGKATAEAEVLHGVVAARDATISDLVAELKRIQTTAQSLFTNESDFRLIGDIADEAIKTVQAATVGVGE